MSSGLEEGDFTGVSPFFLDISNNRKQTISWSENNRMNVFMFSITLLTDAAQFLWSQLCVATWEKLIEKRMPYLKKREFFWHATVTIANIMHIFIGDYAVAWGCDVVMAIGEWWVMKIASEIFNEGLNEIVHSKGNCTYMGFTMVTSCSKAVNFKDTKANCQNSFKEVLKS